MPESEPNKINFRVYSSEEKIKAVDLAEAFTQYWGVIGGIVSPEGVSDALVMQSFPDSQFIANEASKNLSETATLIAYGLPMKMASEISQTGSEILNFDMRSGQPVIVMIGTQRYEVKSEGSMKN